MFQREKPRLPSGTRREAARIPVTTHDAMARDEKRDAVAAEGIAHGARGPGTPDPARQFRISERPSEGDAGAGPQDFLLKGGVSGPIEADAGNRAGVSREIPPDFPRRPGTGLDGLGAASARGRQRRKIERSDAAGGRPDLENSERGVEFEIRHQNLSLNCFCSSSSSRGKRTASAVSLEPIFLS